MKILKFTFNPFQENTYLVVDENNNAVIIDPGCYFREEKQLLKKIILEREIKLKAILNTHAHIDHVMGVAFVKDEFQVPFYLHEKDVPVLEMAERSALLYGLNEYEVSPQPDFFLEEGKDIIIDGISLQVIFGPGHAPGHVAFYNSEDKILIGGDILFQGSYGRVDLPSGDFETLKHTITQKIFTLPEDTVVYSGHGPETTIGAENKTNPILW